MNWPNGFPPDSDRDRERERGSKRGRGSKTVALELKQQFSAINYRFFIYICMYMQSNDASRHHYYDNAGSFPRQQNTINDSFPIHFHGQYRTGGK